RFEDVDGLIVNRIPDYQRFCEIAGLNPSYVSTTPGQGRFSGICIETAAALIRDRLATIVALVYGNNGRSGGDRYGGARGRHRTRRGPPRVLPSPLLP